MPRVYKFHERIEESAKKRGVKNVKGPFIDMILPMLMGFLQKCLQPAPIPTPQPSTSKATPLAWQKADETKAFAIGKMKAGQDPKAEVVEYRGTVTNAAARELRKKERKKGDKMTKEEAINICYAHLDQARLGALEENAVKLDETKSV